MDIEKIKDRIAKLLAMARDAASPNEAAIAAERARKLMDTYQLEEANIGTLRQERFNVATADRPYRFMPKWKEFLAVAVAQYNDCQAVREDNGDNTKFILFRGYDDDVGMGVEMYERLCQAVETWCQRYMTAQGYVRYDAKVGDAYKSGMQGELCSRLRAMTTERDALTTNAGTALVVIKAAGVAGEFGEVKYRSVRRQVDLSNANVVHANARGRTDGANVEINRSVQSDRLKIVNG